MSNIDTLSSPAEELGLTGVSRHTLMHGPWASVHPSAFLPEAHGFLTSKQTCSVMDPWR